MKDSHGRLGKRTLAIGSMLLLLMVSSGCVAVAAGAGASAIAYIRGELNSSLEATVTESTAAAQAAIADLRLTEISSKADALSAELIARDAQDNKIVISLKRNTDHITSISIRVGTFGDQEVSLTILENIKKHL